MKVWRPNRTGGYTRGTFMEPSVQSYFRTDKQFKSRPRSDTVTRYRRYEARKRALQDRNLSPELYQQAICRLCKELGI